MSRTIDLEGIGVDGFGYTVTITGPKRQRRTLRMRTSKKREEEGELEGRQKGANSIQGQHLKPTFEVVTKKTFDVTEAFGYQGLSEENLCPVSPINQLRSFEEVEIGIEQAAAGLKDWSLLDTQGAVTTLPGVGDSSCGNGAEACSPSISIPSPPPSAAFAPT